MDIVAGLRRTAFVLLVSSIAVVGSERIFWFWTPEPLAHLEMAAYYALPTGVLLWALAKYRVSGWWSFLLAAPLFGYVTEGVITPIMYTGGPFVPFFPAWFAFWHGVFAVGLLVFAFRRWLLANDTAALSIASIGVGVFWGTWSSTLWLPGNAEDPEIVADQGGLLHILDPGEFALYAVTFTAILAASHWLLGYVWPTRFEPTRWTRRLWIAAQAIMITAWTVVVPWALPMFALYAWIQYRALAKHRAAVAGPTLLEQLEGRVRARALLPFSLIAATAAGTYAAWWAIDPGELWLNVVYFGTVVVEAIAGFVIVVKALRRAGRPDAPLRPVAVPAQASGASAASTAASA